MKKVYKLLSIITLSLFMTCLVSIKTPETGLAKSLSQKDQLSIFLSNFSEAFFPNTTEKNLSNEKLIDFGILHNMLNNYKRYKVVNSNMLIPRNDIDKSCIKYFGKKPSSHKTVNYYKYDKNRRMYYLPIGDGESYSCVKVTQIKKISSNIYMVYGNEYIGIESFFTPKDIVKPLSQLRKEFDELEQCGKIAAKVHKLKDRYILLSYNRVKVSTKY